MKRHFAAAFIFLLSMPVAAAAQMQAESRTVKEVSDPARSLLISEAMIFQDFSKTHGIRFTPGTYRLEAEDDDYFYYRAPDQIEYRVIRNGAPSDGRFMPGGIYFSKALISLVPAGAYLTNDGTHKTLTWKLGVEFTHLEFSNWTRTGSK